MDLCITFLIKLNFRDETGLLKSQNDAGNLDDLDYSWRMLIPFCIINADADEKAAWSSWTYIL